MEEHQQVFENNENGEYRKIQGQEVDHDHAFFYLSSFPPGYRFEPHDHELIDCYLVPKINGHPLPTNLMHEINIYKHNPEYLTDTFKAQGQNIWYFFTPRDRKYRNGRRPNRKAGDGYWKATGADKVIKHQGIEVGFRKALVFYKGKPPKGDKTPWIMHEFRVSGPPQANKRKPSNDCDTEDTSMRLDDYVLCRIYKKEEGLNRNQSGSQEKQETQDEEPADYLPSRHDNLASFDDQPDETDSSSVDNNITPIIRHNIPGPEITSYNNLNIMNLNKDINFNSINQYSPIMDAYVGINNNYAPFSMFKPVAHPAHSILMHGLRSDTNNDAGYLDFSPHENDHSLIYDQSLIVQSLSEPLSDHNDILGTDFDQNLLPPCYGGDHDMCISTKFDDDDHELCF